MSNTFGKIFRLTTFGESHGKAIGGIIDGFPSNITIDFDFIQTELDKRKPGTSKLTTQRKEPDKVEILSGIFDEKSTGTSIGFIIPNKNQLSGDYEHLKNIYRPGHADYTYQQKYRIRDYNGGGRASARETANWIVGGAFAKLFLQKFNIKINAYSSQIGQKKLIKKYSDLDLSKTYDNTTRCPEFETHLLFEKEILNAKKNKDSIGGIISCVIKNCPIGLGEPVFDKFNARLGAAILSINACKGFEIGEGFNSANLTGAENNDFLVSDEQNIKFASNNSGGVLGGITTGQDIYIRAAFKPTPTIGKVQKTIDNNFNEVTLQATGRHDPCVVPRAVAVVEAMAAMVVADFILIRETQKF